MHKFWNEEKKGKKKKTMKLCYTEERQNSHALGRVRIGRLGLVLLDCCGSEEE